MLHCSSRKGIKSYKNKGKKITGLKRDAATEKQGVLPKAKGLFVSKAVRDIFLEKTNRHRIKALKINKNKTKFS